MSVQLLVLHHRRLNLATDQLEHGPVWIFEAHHADLRAPWPVEHLQGRNELDVLGLQFFIDRSDVIDQERDPADTDIV